MCLGGVVGASGAEASGRLFILLLELVRQDDFGRETNNLFNLIRLDNSPIMVIRRIRSKIKLEQELLDTTPRH